MVNSQLLYNSVYSLYSIRNKIDHIEGDKTNLIKFKTTEITKVHSQTITELTRNHNRKVSEKSSNT